MKTLATPIAIHYQPIFRFIQSKIQNSEDAQDLTQEVFYKLINSTSSIDNQQNWLFKIAKNTVIDYYRKKKIITEEIDSELFIDLQSEELLMTDEQQTCLKDYLLKLIEELPEGYRQIIKMSDIEGLSQKEISEELGLNYTTVRSKVQRGRAMLKKTILDCCDVIQGGKGSIIGYRKRTNSPCDCNNNQINYL